MGVYHQGGVVPASLFVANHLPRDNVIWWKTYPPPTWLLANNGSITTIDLMDMKYDSMVEIVEQYKGCDARNYLVAPLSAQALDGLKEREEGWGVHLVWEFSRHLNLDDMEFGDDGVVETLKRVVGRRGIGIWEIRGQC